MKRFFYTPACHSREGGNPPLVRQAQNSQIHLFLKKERWIPAFAGMTRWGIAIFLLTLAALASASAPVSALAEAPAKEPIKIGEINSYTSFADYSKGHKMGVDLAVGEINREGGILGRPLEIFSRDDKGDAGEGVRVAQELLDRDHVSLIMGTVFDHVKLAVSNLVQKRKIPFFCSSGGTDKFIWQEGNPYILRLDVGMSFIIALFADEAAKLPAKRWATIAPTIEYGKDMVENFKRELLKRRPDVEFVSEQWYTYGKLDAGAAVAALKASKPDAIMSAVLGSDLTQFVRQGKVRGLFEGKEVIAPWVGFQMHIEPLGKETPEGWITNGMPYTDTGNPALEAFIKNYKTKFGEQPKDSSLFGYITVKTIAAAITKAGSLDAEKVAKAARGLTVETPVGPISYRSIDGQSTLGMWLGKTGFNKEGKPALVDWHYVAPTPYFPSDEAIRKMMKGKHEL